MAQSSPEWMAHVVSDASPVGALEKIQDYFEGNDKIRFTKLLTRRNDWGHTPRNIGLEQASAEWVCMTGEDNYYTPNFVKEVLDRGTAAINFIYTDMIHNWTHNQYDHIYCSPRTGKIDVGNSIFRTEFARQMRLDTTHICADGEFVEEYIKRFPGGIAHIEKPLYVHN
jgi:glycosyltransferase involved in cell wall biosynthesis